MPSDKDSIANTITVALVLCIVCSVIVAGSAVLLKPMQTANKLLDRNRNILAAAGLYQEGVHTSADVRRLFEQFDVRIVDLESGEFVSDEKLAELGIDPMTYDQRAASRNPALSKAIESGKDIAGIKRRARYALAYLLEDEGRISKVVLPVHGYGLWGTLYGYMAVEGDGKTVAGLGFYDHKETPGLGGEVDNPSWKAQWQGKEIYDADGDVALQVAKGKVSPDAPNREHRVDGLSGATLTSRGVTNMVQYWLGERGFGPFLDNLKEGQA